MLRKELLESESGLVPPEEQQAVQTATEQLALKIRSSWDLQSDAPLHSAFHVRANIGTALVLLVDQCLDLPFA